MQITVISPKSEEAKLALASRVAQAHGALATKMVQRLSCSSQQKQQLMDAAIAAVRTQARQI